jgi:ABC-type multidrug transport system ATPase subunit
VQQRLRIGARADGTVPDQRAPSGGVAISAVGVTRSLRGGRVVLRDVSLTVRPGELVAVAGASGAGKSTLLEVLAGLCKPEAGRVLLDGVDLATHPHAFRSSLGWVPQDDTVHTELPLRRTLLYAARLRLPGAGPTVIDAAVDDAISTLELSNVADVRVSALSGGQRKRASIAADLLTRPRVFFLDEPTSGLDPATANGLMRTLRRLADSGVTVVFTTHSIPDLASCDRVVFLAAGGHLAFDGRPADALVAFDWRGSTRSTPGSRASGRRKSGPDCISTGSRRIPVPPSQTVVARGNVPAVQGCSSRPAC